MRQFPLQLLKREDPETGMASIGFIWAEHFVCNATRDPVTGQAVDPGVYGLSGTDAELLDRINAAVLAATQAAVDAGLLALGRAIGGDFDQVIKAYFSDRREIAPVGHPFAEFLAHHLGA
jgi:hypothetical protein